MNLQPFANDSDSVQIGELVIENQAEKLIIYGDIDIYKDQQGYQQAKQLHDLTCALLAQFTALEKADRLADISPARQQAQQNLSDAHKCTVDNPFL